MTQKPRTLTALQPRWKFCKLSLDQQLVDFRLENRTNVQIQKTDNAVATPSACAFSASAAFRGLGSQHLEGNVTNEKSSDDCILSDAQMREVIERATRELPERSGITVAELRRIAQELDIDPASLERALDEVISLPVAGQPVRNWCRRQLTKIGHFVDPFLPSKGRLVGGAVFGSIAGWLYAFLATFAINGHYPVAIAMVGITLANLLSRRLDRSLTRFLAETYAMWGVYAAFFAGTYGTVTGGLVFWVALWTSVLTVVGWLLMRDPSGGGASPSLPALAPKVPGETSTDSQQSLREIRAQPVLIWADALRMSRA